MQGCLLQESARVGDAYIDPGMIEDPAAEFSEAIAHQFHHLGIDFYRVDTCGIMVEGLQDSA